MKSRVLQVLSLATAYALLGLAGLQVALPPGNVTSVWLPSGIALGALLVFGRGVWPGIALGSLVCNLVVTPGDVAPLVRFGGALAIALSSTAGLLLSHALIERGVGREVLSPPRLVRLLASIAAGATVTSLGGLLITRAISAVDLPLSFWLTWWVGDALGMLMLAPLVLSEGPPPPRRSLEWVGSLALQLVVLQLVFGRPIAGLGGTTMPAAGLLLPAAVWAGVRLGARGVVVHTLLLHFVVTWATHDRVGPFGATPGRSGLVIVDVLVVLVLMTGLVLAASAAELRGHQALLEARVRERTAELEQANQRLRDETEQKARLGAQLVEAQKQDALGRLAGGVAHDFNNLLTVMAGEAELLQRTPSAEVQDAAAAILGASHRAAELTRQLLAVARRQPSSPRAVGLRDALLATRRLLRPVLPEDIVLDVDCDPACTVLIDPGQLDQLVLNLALNARDAISGSGWVRVSGERRTLDDAAARALGLTAGDWVLLTVRDSGTGISPEVLPRVFEPFFTTKAGERGTGLGLSTVWGIASQAQGTVKASNASGGGAVFEVWLPATGQPAEQRADAQREPPLADGKTVLVVEDEPMVRRTVVRALELDGYRVILASDGEEALAICRDPSTRFDLLLTDVVMPRLGGVELARAVRERRRVPVLFMSGFHERQAELASEHVLAKPFVPAQLTAAVAAALGGKR